MVEGLCGAGGAQQADEKGGGRGDLASLIATAKPAVLAKAFQLIEDGLGIKEGMDTETVLFLLAEYGPALKARLSQQIDDAHARAREEAQKRRDLKEAALARRAQLYDALKGLDEYEARPETEEEALKAAVKEAELAALEEEKRYMAQVQRAEALEKAALAKQDAEHSLEVFDSLVEARNDEFPELDGFVCATGRTVVDRWRETMIQDLAKSLVESSWPRTMGDEEAQLSPAARNAATHVVRLQGAAIRVQHADADPSSSGLWLATELSTPVLQRFVFHFVEGSEALEGGAGGGQEESKATKQPAAGRGSTSPLPPTATTNRPDWCISFLTGCLRLGRPVLSDPSLTSLIRERIPVYRQLRHPLLALFTRDLTNVSRTKLAAMLAAAWGSDAAVLHVVEQLLVYDKAVEELGAYAPAPGEATKKMTWPSAIETVTSVPEVLERWLDIDQRRAKAMLEEDCEKREMWEPAVSDEMSGEGPPPPTRAAQGFAALLQHLLGRYRPVRDPSALRALVTKVIKPVILSYLNHTYTAAKACRVERAPFSQAFKEQFSKYCHVVTSTRVALEAVEDAAADVVMVRLEGKKLDESSGGPKPLIDASHGIKAAVGAASAGAALIQEGVGTAIKTASATTEQLSRVVDESGTIIGPTRFVRQALTRIGHAVTSSPKPGSDAAASPARPSPASSTVTSASSGSSTKVEVGSPMTAPSMATEADPTSALEQALQRMEGEEGIQQQQGVLSSASALSFELHHLSNFYETMLQDAMSACRAGFHYKTNDYFVYSFPPPPIPLNTFSATLYPALAFLEQALSVGKGALEAEALLRLWQDIVMTISETFLSEIRKARSFSETNGRQLAQDVTALRQVLSMPPRLRPDTYLVALSESVKVLSSPTRSLDSLHGFLSDMMSEWEAVEPGSVEEGQLKMALEARGIVVLGPEEVLALCQQRRKGDTAARGRMSPAAAGLA